MNPNIFPLTLREQKKNENNKIAAVSADGRPNEKQSTVQNPAEKAAAAPQSSQNNSPAQTDSAADEFGTGSSRSVETMPTVMLDGGSGSFLGDIINMAKFTRNLYKKK